jgi:hypothetical protein
MSGIDDNVAEVVVVLVPAREHNRIGPLLG